MENWFKKHADTLVIVGMIFAGFFWADVKFGNIDKRFSEVDRRFSEIEKEIAIVKTVMLMKNILPSELAHHAIETEGK